MLIRIISAIIAIAFAVVFTFIKGGLPFTICVAVVAAISSFEYFRCVKRKGARPILWIGVLVVIILAVSPKYDFGKWYSVSITALLITSFIRELTNKERQIFVNLGATALGVIYVGWLISHVTSIRVIHGTTRLWGMTYETGAILIMYVFLITWACDSSAYFIGKYFGKKKFVPKISPNKTIEGAIGGFCGAIIFAFGIGYLISIPFPHSLILGIILGILCEAGDLFASALKREMGIKDFGNIMPGHGGALDRLDSLLFTAPAAYYYFIIFLKDWLK
ncbi:MAG: phosphatidate cytidylyltransferase [Armatimonadota bacterium]